MATSLRARLQAIYNRPFAQRLIPDSYADQHNFQEIVPGRNWTVNPYQTFWQGNQLPSFMLTNIPHAAYVRIRDQAITQAQRSGGGFAPLQGYQIGQLGTARNLGVMRALWARAQMMAYQNNNS